MANELMKVEFESLSGITVRLDADTVKNTLTRGNGKVTDQEVAMFLRTCQAKRLDPLENGEVYLIKYDDKAPANLVVGCHAYVRRADHFPEYRGCKSGVSVAVRGKDGVPKVIQKEGCCVYKAIGEELVGGWCRVYRERKKGYIEETYIEVSLEEYSTGKSNWLSKPATMICKVAKSQAFRMAFPNEYEGLYTIDEMQASGAVPDTYVIDDKTGEVIEVDAEPVEELITQEQRQDLFKLVKEKLGAEGNDVLKQVLTEFGLDSTAKITTSTLKHITERIEEVAGQIPQKKSNQ